MPIRRPTLAIASGIALMFAASTASAGILGSLVFTNPTGIAGPNDNVAPWLRFSLDAGSDPIDLTDPGSFASLGFETVTFASVTIGFGCSDTFTGGCNADGHPYRFEWNLSPTEGYPVVQRGDLKMNPGDGLDFSPLTFIPNGGPVPAGTYSLPLMAVELLVSGTQWAPVHDNRGNVVLDSDGNAVKELKDSTYYQPWFTCDDFHGKGCAAPHVFTRTIIAVPEPETYATLLAGLGLLGAIARRRKP